MLWVVDEDRVVERLRAAGARFAFVFGSRAGTSGPWPEPRPDSDLDVAAWWGSRESPGEWELDVPLGEGIDLVVLDRCPLFLAGPIALHGRLLFDDDPPARVAWQADTRLRYLDERPFLDELDALVKERLARGG